MLKCSSNHESGCQQASIFRSTSIPEARVPLHSMKERVQVHRSEAPPGWKNMGDCRLSGPSAPWKKRSAKVYSGSNRESLALLDHPQSLKGEAASLGTLLSHVVRIWPSTAGAPAMYSPDCHVIESRHSPCSVLLCGLAILPLLSALLCLGTFSLHSSRRMSALPCSIRDVQVEKFPPCRGFAWTPGCRVPRIPGVTSVQTVSGK